MHNSLAEPLGVTGHSDYPPAMTMRSYPGKKLVAVLLDVRLALYHFGLFVARQGASFRIPTIVVFGKLSQRLSAVERASLIRLANA
jgi:hypothetical protein